MAEPVQPKILEKDFREYLEKLKETASELTDELEKVALSNIIEVLNERFYTNQQRRKMNPAMTLEQLQEMVAKVRESAKSYDFGELDKDLHAARIKNVVIPNLNSAITNFTPPVVEEAAAAVEEIAAVEETPAVVETKPFEWPARDSAFVAGRLFSDNGYPTADNENDKQLRKRILEARLPLVEAYNAQMKAAGKNTELAEKVKSLNDEIARIQATKSENLLFTRYTPDYLLLGLHGHTYIRNFALDSTNSVGGLKPKDIDTYLASLGITREEYDSLRTKIDELDAYCYAAEKEVLKTLSREEKDKFGALTQGFEDSAGIYPGEPFELRDLGSIPKADIGRNSDYATGRIQGLGGALAHYNFVKEQALGAQTLSVTPATPRKTQPFMTPQDFANYGDARVRGMEDIGLLGGVFDLLVKQTSEGLSPTERMPANLTKYRLKEIIKDVKTKTEDWKKQQTNPSKKAILAQGVAEFKAKIDAIKVFELESARAVTPVAFDPKAPVTKKSIYAYAETLSPVGAKQEQPTHKEIITLEVAETLRFLGGEGAGIEVFEKQFGKLATIQDLHTVVDRLQKELEELVATQLTEDGNINKLRLGKNSLPSHVIERLKAHLSVYPNPPASYLVPLVHTGAEKIKTAFAAAIDALPPEEQRFYATLKPAPMDTVTKQFGDNLRVSDADITLVLDAAKKEIDLATIKAGEAFSDAELTLVHPFSLEAVSIAFQKKLGAIIEVVSPDGQGKHLNVMQKDNLKVALLAQSKNNVKRADDTPTKLQGLEVDYAHQAIDDIYDKLGTGAEKYKEIIDAQLKRQEEAKTTYTTPDKIRQALQDRKRGNMAVANIEKYLGKSFSITDAKLDEVLKTLDNELALGKNTDLEHPIGKARIQYFLLFKALAEKATINKTDEKYNGHDSVKALKNKIKEDFVEFVIKNGDLLQSSVTNEAGYRLSLQDEYKKAAFEQIYDAMGTKKGTLKDYQEIIDAQYARQVAAAKTVTKTELTDIAADMLVTQENLTFDNAVKSGMAVAMGTMAKDDTLPENLTHSTLKGYIETFQKTQEGVDWGDKKPAEAEQAVATAFTKVLNGETIEKLSFAAGAGTGVTTTPDPKKADPEADTPKTGKNFTIAALFVGGATVLWNLYKAITGGHKEQAKEGGEGGKEGDGEKKGPGFGRIAAITVGALVTGVAITALYQGKPMNKVFSRSA